MPTELESTALADAIEAAADALLTVCAAAVVVRTGEAATMTGAVDLAADAIARILERTGREGARPRG